MPNVCINKGRPQIPFRTSYSGHLPDCTAIPPPPVLDACSLSSTQCPGNTLTTSGRKGSDYGSMKIAAETVLYAKPIGSYRN